MSNELEFSIKVRNELLGAIDDNIEALRKFAKAEEDLSNSEKKIAKDLLDTFSQRERSSAKQAASTIEQSKALNNMAAMIEKVRKSNQGVDAAATNALKSLQGNEAEIKRIYDELSKLDKKGQELIENVSRAASAGNIGEVERLMNEFQQGLDPEQAKVFADAVEESMGKTENAIARPSRELRELKRQIAAGELEGEPLQVAIRRAAELEDEIGDVAQRIKALSSDTYNLDAIVGGFDTLAGGAAVAEGAIALLGVESEDFQETMVRLNALMAISQGLQSVSNQLLGEGAFKTKLISSAQTVYAAAVGTSTGSMKAFRVALLATGIGAAVIAIGALVANWDKLSSAISGTTREQELNSEITKKANDSVAEELTNLDVKLIKINALNVGEKERTRLIQELQAEYPNYLGNIDAETVTTDQLTSSVMKLREAYVARATIQGAQDLLVENTRKKLQLQNQDLQESLSWTDKLYRSAQSYFDITGAAVGATNDAQQNISEANAEIARDEQFLTKVIEEETRKLQEMGGDPEQYEKPKAIKKVNNTVVKDQQSFYNEMSRLFDEANQREIDSLKGEEKLAALAAVEDEKISIVEETTKRLAREAGFQGEELAAKYVEIEEYIGKLRIDAQQKAVDALIEFRAEEAAKAIEQEEQAFAERQDRLQRQEEIEINRAAVRLESQRGQFEDEQSFEEFKNQELLKINLEYAKQKLELLKSSTDEEAELQRSQLERTISELQAQVQRSTPEQAAQTEKTFLMSLLGLDEQGIAAFKDAAAQAAQAVLGLYATANAARIQDVDNQIQASDDLLSSLNERLEREMQLKEEGLANSVASVEEEIAIEKEKREAALKEKQKLQKRQALVDAAAQASSLITATAQIFAAESTKGLVGVLTAVGAIASLFAIFTATKAKIKSATQLRKGGSGDKYGMITGRSHEQGGENFLDHVEVEDGEGWGVLSRPATRKYGNQFHKMVEWMNNTALAPKVSAPFVPSIAYVNHPDFEQMRYGRNASAGNDAVDELRTTNKKLDQIEKRLKKVEEKPTTWTEGDDVTVVKIGNKIRKFRKKKDL